MFLINYFKDSFNFKELLVVKKRPMYKIIIYFVIIVFIATFPLTLEAIKNEGSRLDFVIEDFREVPVSWDFPSGLEIRGYKLNIEEDMEIHYIHKEINYYFIGKDDIVYNDYLNSIVFLNDKIVYINENGNYMEGKDYQAFGLSYQFDAFRNASQQQKYDLYQEFAEKIESSFSNQIVLYTILRNISIQLFANIIYVLILSLLVQLYKFGYAKFISYLDGLKFVIVSLGAPAMLAFIIGIFSAAFAPVAFQLFSGLVVMLVPLIFGKKIYS